MLALEIEFLTGRYRATHFRERDATEWPPHPSRVFSALVAAHYEAALGRETREALLWLEQQPAPEIAASDAVEREVALHYVPVNDNSLPQEFRNRQPRAFPTVWPSSPVVHLLWPQAKPSAPIRAALDELAAFTTYIGHSSSLVRLSFRDEAEVNPTFRPDSRGELNLRVPKAGRLSHLDQRWKRGQPVDAGTFERYGAINPKVELPTATSAFDEMLIVRCAEGSAVPLSATIHLTSILRDAMLEKGGADAPAIFHGHGDAPHAAYVPLPFIGHKHADGHVLGLAAVLPRELSRPDRRAFVAAFGELVQLTLGNYGVWKVEAVAQPSGTQTLNPDTWMRAEKTWATVTPIVFDHFPRDREGRRAAEIIADSCVRAGLPVPAHVDLSNHSKFIGVPPVREFRIRRRESDPPRPATHAVLHFDRPVHGPVLIGAGRFFGLGLCRPVKIKANESARS
jgi:CRISPR-associated protein Csb2